MLSLYVISDLSFELLIQLIDVKEICCEFYAIISMCEDVKLAFNLRVTKYGLEITPVRI